LKPLQGAGASLEGPSRDDLARAVLRQHCAQGHYVGGVQDLIQAFPERVPKLARLDHTDALEIIGFGHEGDDVFTRHPQ